MQQDRQGCMLSEQLHWVRGMGTGRGMGMAMGMERKGKLIETFENLMVKRSLVSRQLLRARVQHKGQMNAP